MPKAYNRILAAVASTMWAMQPEKQRAMLEFLAIKLAGGSVDAARFTPAQDRKVASQSGGVAVLPLFGVISQRLDMFSDISGGTSTEKFAKDFMSLVSNAGVKAIIIDVDSPGGNITGVTELAALIRGARGTKPIIAQVNSLCASAAFWIASAADEIVVTPSGEIGSVGVYSLHEDVSKMYEEAGVKETFVYRGEYKVEGNPYEPLSDEARADWQRRIDATYEMFVSDLAAGRGMSKADVERDFGQGRCFGAQEAVARKMADRIGTMKDTLERFGASLYAGDQSRKAAPERMRREAELIMIDTR